MMKQTSNQHEIKFYRDLREGVSDRITFHQPSNVNSSGISLEFFTDSQSLILQLRFDWYGTLGRCVLRYGILLFHFFKVVACTVLCTQIYSYTQTKNNQFQPFSSVFWQCLSGPFLQLACIIIIFGVLQCTIPSHIDHGVVRRIYSALLVGTNEWIMIGLMLFFFVLSIGFTAIIWTILYSLTSALAFCCKPLSFIEPILSLQQRVILLVAITLGALKTVPSSIIIVGYILLWLLLTSMAKYDLYMYRYRLTWLLFLISLLPNHVPQVIVYVKNLLVGWTAIAHTPWQETLTIALLASLMIIGRTPIIMKRKRFVFQSILVFVYLRSSSAHLFSTIEQVCQSCVSLIRSSYIKFCLALFTLSYSLI
ncbi:hypothetical protein BD560DRAFT_215552 [Blakeslea trispora]|nr:hypothetical protein BD560DRAFT_215552 [Blakeslea trispora]